MHRFCAQRSSAIAFYARVEKLDEISNLATRNINCIRVSDYVLHLHKHNYSHDEGKLHILIEKKIINTLANDDTIAFAVSRQF